MLKFFFPLDKKDFKNILLGIPFTFEEQSLYLKNRVYSMPCPEKLSMMGKIKNTYTLVEKIYSVYVGVNISL